MQRRTEEAGDEDEGVEEDEGAEADSKGGSADGGEGSGGSGGGGDGGESSFQKSVSAARKAADELMNSGRFKEALQAYEAVDRMEAKHRRQKLLQGEGLATPVLDPLLFA
jgi:hypothetical protein